jgi:DNA processing protein
VSGVKKTRRSTEQELREAVAFSLLPGVGCVAFKEGVERFGSAADAFRATGSDRERVEALRAADALIRRAAAASSRILLQGDDNYPPALLELPQAPSLLFTLGDPRLLASRRVGIVGTRHSSASGERIAHQMAGMLARAGAVVVSGMAFGIDAAAHRGALDAGGGTIAVLGGGVDVPYPPSHAALHERIAREGLVLSEAPIGSRPVKGAFPKRNRIIAALSELLVVIEAGERSGALITSRVALDLGRNVAAVPGPIDSARNVGSNRLLADGASIIANLDDVILLAGLRGSAAVDTLSDTHGDQDSSQLAILEAMGTGASAIDDLARSTRLPPRDLAAALSTLELNGHVIVSDEGTVSRSARV